MPLTAPRLLAPLLALTCGAALAAPPICPPEPPESPEREAAWTRALESLSTLSLNLPEKAEPTVLMPVDGVRVRDVDDTWGGARPDARQHAGQDIFAPPGTFVRSATDGLVWRIGESAAGGRWVYVLGAGGRRYYYAHLDRVNSDLREGQRVTARTILGVVGQTGNAVNTPAHLHFSIFTKFDPAAECRFLAINPLPLLRDRP